MSENLLDCLVVGAGPAGLTAATYLARFRRHILLAAMVVVQKVYRKINQPKYNQQNSRYDINNPPVFFLHFLSNKTQN